MSANLGKNPSKYMHSPAGGREGNTTQAGQRGGKEKGTDGVKPRRGRRGTAQSISRTLTSGQNREGQRHPPVNNAWLLLSAAGEELGPHPRAAAGQVTSQLCPRPQGEVCHPNATRFSQCAQRAQFGSIPLPGWGHISRLFSHR